MWTYLTLTLHVPKMSEKKRMFSIIHSMKYLLKPDFKIPQTVYHAHERFLVSYVNVSWVSKSVNLGKER